MYSYFQQSYISNDDVVKSSNANKEAYFAVQITF